ncbi:DUF3040 domain-containing protein [Leucobacter sp. NPDC077196]|uniref:DUF3040 domain-containing protein n=1 Tax=Leucobacter sp. NPDC077196 TaxID=3154959 RepID=UPI00342D91D6
MALSEHEQRLLDEMERGFYQSEADVLQAGSSQPRRLNYRSLVLGIIVVVAGIGVLVAGVAVHLLWVGLIGFAVMLGGVILMLSRRSSDPLTVEDITSAGSGPKSPRSSRESLSERMERRWDQRMEGER